MSAPDRVTRLQAVSPSTDTWAGQAAYTPFSLKIYDALVLGLSSRCFWRCPSSEILVVYDANVSANHLDVGVATGYYLDACRFPTAAPRLGLLDLNPLCLETAARRIARYRPETYQADVLAPIDLSPDGWSGDPFDSLGITFLLHCLPGPMTRKAAAFANLKPLLNPGARVFGATILGRGVPHNALGRRLMAFYNGKGIFGNEEDDPEGLRAALAANFVDVELRLKGAVALFTARA
jgi:hypothetical protein